MSSVGPNIVPTRPYQLFLKNLTLLQHLSLTSLCGVNNVANHACFFINIYNTLACHRAIVSYQDQFEQRNNPNNSKKPYSSGGSKHEKNGDVGSENLMVNGGYLLEVGMEQNVIILVIKHSKIYMKNQII